MTTVFESIFVMLELHFYPKFLASYEGSRLQMMNTVKFDVNSQEFVVEKLKIIHCLSQCFKAAFLVDPM